LTDDRVDGITVVCEILFDVSLNFVDVVEILDNLCCLLTNTDFNALGTLTLTGFHDVLSNDCGNDVNAAAAPTAIAAFVTPTENILLRHTIALGNTHNTNINVRNIL
jgi:hypothetical protein